MSLARSPSWPPNDALAHFLQQPVVPVGDPAHQAVFFQQAVWHARASALPRDVLDQMTATLQPNVERLVLKTFRLDGAEWHVDIVDSLDTARLLVQQAAAHAREAFMPGSSPVFYADAAVLSRTQPVWSWNMPAASWCALPRVTLAAVDEADAADATTTGVVMTTLDHDQFEVEVEHDESQGRAPAAVLLQLGNDRDDRESSLTLDDIITIGDVCERHNVWCHVDGHRAIALTGLLPSSSATGDAPDHPYAWASLWTTVQSVALPVCSPLPATLLLLRRPPRPLVPAVTALANGGAYRPDPSPAPTRLPGSPGLEMPSLSGGVHAVHSATLALGRSSDASAVEATVLPPLAEMPPGDAPAPAVLARWALAWNAFQPHVRAPDQPDIPTWRLATPLDPPLIVAVRVALGVTVH